MKTVKKARYIGAAFLIQLFISLSAMVTGIFVDKQFLSATDISQGMVNIAQNPFWVKANIFGETLTAIGLIILASILYYTFQKREKLLATAALGLYICGSTLLVASRAATYLFMITCQKYTAIDTLPQLEVMASLTYDSSAFSITILGFPICTGLLLFYYLFYKTKYIPRVLSIYGILGTLFLIISTFFAIFGFQIPVFVYIFYAPVDLLIGIWISAKGINVEGDAPI